MTSSLTLDDAAAQMVQIDTNDLTGLALLQGLLKNLAENAALPAPVASLLAQSALKVKDVILEESSDWTAAMAEAVFLLEAAMEAEKCNQTLVWARNR